MQRFPAPGAGARPKFRKMTTLPSEINPDAVKNSPAEKVTPMMQQRISPMKSRNLKP